MKNKLNIIISAVLFCLLLSSASAATGIYDRFQYGLFANFELIRQDAAFKSMPNTFSCSPGFTKGIGFGANGGILMEIPFGKVLFMGMRAGYSFIRTVSEAEEEFPYQFGDNILMGRIIYRNEINLHGGRGEMYLGLRPFDGMILSAGVVGEYVFMPAFTQFEKLDKPSDFGAFENGKRTRNEYYNKKINDISIPVLFAKATLSYEILLNETGTVRLAPEISYLYPINSLIKNYDWKLSGLSAGASLKFSSKPENPLFVDISTKDEIVSANFTSCDTSYFSTAPSEITLFANVSAPSGVSYWELKVLQNNRVLYLLKDTNEVPPQFSIPIDWIYKNKQDTQPISYKLFVQDKENKKAEKEGRIPLNHDNKELLSDFEHYGLDDNGNKISQSNINIERKILTEVHPLLNYIFFDENSDKIAQRYRKIRNYETNTFEINNYKNDDILGIYRNILNIIGQRLQKNPNAELFLKGYVSDNPSEANNLLLANNRANTIKEYLRNIWGIADNRIIIEANQNASGLPPKPSNPGDENHFQETDDENQRVELFTKPEYSFLLDPVTTSDTISSISPTKFVFKPQIQSSGQQYKWNLDIGLNGKLLQQFAVNNRERDSVLIDLKSKKSELMKNDGVLSYFYFLKDEYGLQCYKEGEINLDLSEADSSVNKYSLILFDFRSYELGERNNQMVDLIRSSFSNNSSLLITGFTDILGDSIANLALSKNRALSAAKAIFNDNSLQADSKYPINNSASHIVIDKKYYQTLAIKKNVSNVNVTVQGLGESAPLLYDNSTPEGRFYSRTVTISVVNQHKE